MDAQILETLRAIPLFSALKDDPEKLKPVAEVMALRHMPAGTLLIREGEMGEELFILRKGAVEISKTTLENEQYTVTILREEQNPFFGELALMDADKRSATIRAIEDCEVLVLSRGDFETLGNRHPEIGLFVMRELAKILSRRLRQTTTDVILLFEALVQEVQDEQFG